MKSRAARAESSYTLPGEAVKANEGAPGPDGKNFQTTGKHIRENREKLSSGAYNPGSIQAVIIRKLNGGERQLGVPNVQDHWIQQAVHQKLYERCELSYSDHSYGFRPNRSAHDALREVKKFIDEGKNLFLSNTLFLTPKFRSESQ